jgi:CRISPR/Cas system-associated endoribonuclease Cas2
MLIVVTYDVSTETAAGRKRLRRVAKVCESMGQRVQKSVFECQVNEMQFEELERRLLGEIDEAEDNGSARPSGRARIETADNVLAIAGDFGSARPSGRARIETILGLDHR